MYSSVKGKHSDKNYSQSEPHSPSTPLLISTTSCFLSSYNDILFDSKIVSRPLTQLLTQLQNHGIYFTENYHKKLNDSSSDQRIHINSIKNTKHFKIVTLNVSLGPFTQSIKIYNLFSPSIFNNIQLLYFGKFTNIYCIEHNCKKYTAKSINFSQAQKSSHSLRQKQFFDIVREYFIAKIMQKLKIGPKLCEQLGFDIFVSQSDAFFFMEFCEYPKGKQFTQRDENILKGSLREMHSLSILHRDIKPSNFMYSKSYDKFVFIDFGISEYIRQSAGCFVLTTFRGTYSYCTQEMKSLFKIRQNSWVDLHYNDAYGLEMSVKEMKNAFIVKEEDADNVEGEICLDDFLIEVKLKYMLFMNEFEEIQDFELMNRNFVSLCDKLMTFLYQIVLTEKIRKVYQNFIEEHVQEKGLYEDLKEALSNKIYFESCKGKRKFTSAQEKIQVQKTQQFYQQIKYEHCQKDRLQRLPIKSLQELLINPFHIDDLPKQTYQTYLIEYLNCKKIEDAPVIEKKMAVCRVYVRLKMAKSKQQLERLSDSLLLELVFRDMLFAMAEGWKIEKFLSFVKALENYLIVTAQIKLELLNLISQVIIKIEKETKLKSLTKIQSLLLILVSLSFFKFKNLKTSVYREFIRIGELTKKKVNQYTQKELSACSQDAEICQLYLSSYPYFMIEEEFLPRIETQQILQQIKLMKAQNDTSERLFNFIQYRLLATLEKGNQDYYRKTQIEEIIVEKMQQDGEFSIILFHIISSYVLNRQVKILKKYIEILDSALQVQSIADQYLYHTRLYLLVLDLNDHECSQIEEKVLKQAKIILESLKVDEQSLMTFSKQAQSFLFFQSTFKSQKSIKVPKCLFQIKDLLLQKIPESLKIYQSMNYPIVYKGSINIFYLQLLYLDLEIEYYDLLSLDNRSSIELAFQYTWHLFPKTKSYNKIISVDRSNFTLKDHIFMLMFDLIKIKSINSPECDRQVINYISGKKALICSAISKENLQQKTYILSSFSLVLHGFNESGSLLMLRQCIDLISYDSNSGICLIYPIVEKKFTCSHLTYGFTSVIMVSLVRLMMFQQIFNEVIETSKFFSDHISNSTINQLCRFYTIVAFNPTYYIIDKEFNLYLKQVFYQLNLKKNPLLSLFLLLCIKPFNRNAILNLVVANLKYIKYNGKYIILSRLYKELLKLKNLSARKRKQLLRKDLCYPSQYMLNLKQMKNKMKIVTGLSDFQGFYKQVMDKKILKLGNCCEIYSPVKLQHRLNVVLNFSSLDSIANQYVLEEWETKEW